MRALLCWAALLGAGCSLEPFEGLGKRCTATATCPEPLICATPTGAELGHCLSAISAPLSFVPTDDVHFKGGLFENQAIFSVENDGAGKVSTTFLRFKVSGLSELPLGASLSVFNVWDAKREGTYRVFVGSHSNWTETTISSASAPTPLRLVATRSASIPPLAEVVLDVSSAVTSDGELTLVLQAEPGAEPLVIYSSEALSPPRLVVQHASLPPFQ